MVQVYDVSYSKPLATCPTDINLASFHQYRVQSVVVVVLIIITELPNIDTTYITIIIISFLFFIIINLSTASRS